MRSASLDTARPAQGEAGVLRDVVPGSSARVVAVPLDAPTRLRLAQFGIRPGATVQVLAALSGGGRLVGVGSARIALDRVTAAQLEVAG